MASYLTINIIAIFVALIVVIVSTVLIYILSPDQFQRECAVVHNYYRSKHRSPQLSISSKLIAFAEERAEELRRTNVFEHRKGGDYGECLFKTTKSSPKKMSELKCKTAAKHWYDEIEFYDFERGVAKAGHESEQIGHFTQMVWSDTLEIGCAKSFSDSTGITYLVCNYYPHGNVQGTFPKNVPKLRSFFSF